MYSNLKLVGRIEFSIPSKILEHCQYYTKSENTKTSEVHKLLVNYDYLEDLKNISKSIMSQIDE